MIIACDIDQVVLNLIEVWLQKYNSDFGDDLIPEAITDWDLSKFVDTGCGQAIFDYIDHPEVFEESKPIYGAIHAISYLKSQGHRIIYVTINNPENVKDRWLKRYGFMENSEDLYVCKDKSLIMSDFLIDDNPRNIENCYGIGILFTQPHNKKVDWSPRANSWQEVLDIIEGRSDSCALS